MTRLYDYELPPPTATHDDHLRPGKLRRQKDAVIRALQELVRCDITKLPDELRAATEDLLKACE